MVAPLFTVYDVYEFYEGGTVIYRKEAGDSSKNAKLRWTLSGDDETGKAQVFWLWKDGDMSMADQVFQDAYQAYLARLVVM